MATNLDAMPYLGGASAVPSQVARVKEVPLSALWVQPPDRPSGIADRCRAAMFGVYLRYKNIPEETARHIFQEHEGGCAAAWLRVDAHERRMSEAAKLARPGLGDRCLAAMFGLYLRCKGITEDTAREIFAGHVASRRSCVLAWFKVHGRLSDGELAFGRLVPALWKQAEEWVAPYEWASHLRSAAIEKAMDATFRRVVGASDQTRRDAGGLERFAAQALKEALREELTPHWSDWVSQAHVDAARGATRDVAGPQPMLLQAAETSEELDQAGEIEALAAQPEPLEAEQIEGRQLEVVDPSLLRNCLVQAGDAQRKWLNAHENDAALDWRPVAEPVVAGERLAEQIRSMDPSVLGALNEKDLERMYEEQLRVLQEKNPPDPDAVLRSHDFAPELADRAFKMRGQELFAEPDSPGKVVKPEPSHWLPGPSAHTHLNGGAVEEPSARPAKTVRSGPSPAVTTTPSKSNLANGGSGSAKPQKPTGGPSGLLGLGALSGAGAKPLPHPGAPDGRRIKGRQSPAIFRVRESVASRAGEPAGE